MPSEPVSPMTALGPIIARIEQTKRWFEEHPELAAEAERKRQEEEEQGRMWRVRDLGEELDRRRADLLPERVIMAIEGDLQVTEAVRAVREFRDSKTQSVLVLAGPPGVGKTVGAVEAMHYEFRDKEYGVTGTAIRGHFIEASRFSRASNFGADGEAFWRPLEEAYPLVIDDLGTGVLDGKGYVLGNLGNLFRQRYDEDLKTIITTNLTQKAFTHAFLDDRLLDRFKEGGIFVWCGGPSLRKRPPANDPAKEGPKEVGS